MSVDNLFVCYPNSAYFAYGALSMLSNITEKQFIASMKTITGLDVNLDFIDHCKYRRQNYAAIDKLIRAGEQSTINIKHNVRKLVDQV